MGFFIHGLICRALGLPSGLSGRWGHTRWVTLLLVFYILYYSC